MKLILILVISGQEDSSNAQIRQENTGQRR